MNMFGKLSPKIATQLFNAVVEPILTYGSEIWGVNKKGAEQVDKLCLWYLKSTLGVKSSTSSYII